MSLEGLRAMKNVPIMAARFWVNRDTQIHYFESTLEQHMKIKERRGFEVVAVRPGETCVLPHGFYTVHSRDKKPIKGEWLQGVEIMGDKDSKKHVEKSGLKIAPGEGG